MKLDQSKEIKRLVIYFFYDSDGIVDRYVPYMLEDIKKNCSDLFVVCNGKLRSEGRHVFSKFTTDILVRENVGFDVWAYKTALDFYGWDRLGEFDEVILMNYTIMGPLYPFSEVFTEMNGRDVDFWGITKHHKIPHDPFGAIKLGYVPEHIQSHFIAVRRDMLRSNEFKYYWENMPMITSYGEAIGLHEAVFTKTFADAGYTWDIYVNTDNYEGFTYYPLMMDPVRLIQNEQCPIFKRRSFFHDYHDYLANSTGSQAKELLCYLKEKTKFDTGMIWENILRTNNMAAIKDCLQLNYILPKRYTENIPKQKKVALVIHSYFEDLIDYCYEYALAMPDYSDIYITVGSEMKKRIIEERFLNGPWNCVRVILIENRGRDVSALLVGAAQYLSEYEYVCFVHDKKVTQLDLGIKGYSFSERCFQNLLGSKEFVNNVLSLFEDEPYLGMLCPPPPNHSDYYPTLSSEWGPNYDETEKLAKKLNLSIPMSEKREPIAPLGTMFWFRSSAMKTLIEYGWKYTDFPPEPNGVDGTFLHAVERIYPFVVQQSGYYCAWLMNDDYAKTELNNLTFMLRNINTRLFEIYGFNSHFGVLSTMDYYIETGNLCVKNSTKSVLKTAIKKRVPRPIWVIVRTIYRLFGGKQWREDNING